MRPATATTADDEDNDDDDVDDYVDLCNWYKLFTQVETQWKKGLRRPNSLIGSGSSAWKKSKI